MPIAIGIGLGFVFDTVQPSGGVPANAVLASDGSVIVLSDGSYLVTAS